LLSGAIQTAIERCGPVTYKDFLARPAPQLPKGGYWCFHLIDGEKAEWKVDLWSVPRVFILKITPAGRTPPLSGYPIYCAVLDEGLTEMEDIKDYIPAHGVSPDGDGL
jgi:hypothetical protein